MKKNTLSIILFIVTFILTYLIICFAIPGMRIKLAAEPAEYFIESIRFSAFFKTIVSLAVSLIIGTLPIIIRKKK